MRLDSDGRIRAAVLFVAYLLLVVGLTFQPSGGMAGTGVAWAAEVLTRLHAPAPLTDTARLEVVLNVVMLVPLPILGSLVWPRTTWRDWTAYAFVTSLVIELAQVPIATRDASLSDLAANTAGGFVGGLVVLAGRWLLGRRSPVPARAPQPHARTPR
jgi:glycopeptide antibiotics resistance protein